VVDRGLSVASSISADFGVAWERRRCFPGRWPSAACLLITIMQLPVPKDVAGGGGPLEKDPHKGDGSASPSSPGSPGKAGSRQKPVKVLPCPRCESMNTKFCYYNNYSVNQPRHFCRQCQRYWTVGGTLRNVPVGGGSRKKNRHQRGEPYLRHSPGSNNNSSVHLAAIASAGGQGGLLQNAAGGFQQLLTQDLTGLNFAQLYGPYMPQHHHHPQNHFAPFSLADHQNQGGYPSPLSKPDHLSPSSMHAMHGNGAAMSSQVPVPASYYYPDLASLQVASPGNNVAIKTEFWANPNSNSSQQQQQQQQQSVSGNEQGHQAGMWEQARHSLNASSGHGLGAASDDEARTRNSGGQGAVTPMTLNSNNKTPSGGYETSMLLHLGLNTQHQPTPQLSSRKVWSLDVKPGNGFSPPHGSSTIEEEGSTPTNGYSNSGYEEGDAVSSMWPDMHDMQDIFQ
jgi:hypothetical protein